MNIEELVKKHLDANWYGEDSTGYDDVAEAIRAALTELSAAHAIELRAYEATVANQAERIRQLERSLKECEQVREAAMELKDVCNRPSAARTRAGAWRALDKAIKAAAPAKEVE